MGYYVTLQKSTLQIPAENVKEVFSTWCKINDPKYNKHKRGGAFGGGRQTSYWYSWMDEDYDKTCRNVLEILDMLGFESEEAENDDVLITYYSNKTGQEDLFLEVVADKLEGTASWRGEDGETWSNTYPATPRVLEIDKDKIKLLGN